MLDNHINFVVDNKSSLILIKKYKVKFAYELLEKYELEESIDLII